MESQLEMLLSTIGRRMSKPTLTSLSEDIRNLDSRTVAIETEIKIQFKDIYNRFKRLENIIIGSAAAIILLLIGFILNL